MTTLVDAPTRADGVQLIGGMVGSGYRTPPALVRRGDGQVIQLTPLLFLVLKATDGRRGLAEIGVLVGNALRRSMSENDVRSLVDGHLRPLGLLTCADGSQPDLRRSDPLLGLKLRKVITNPRTTHRLTDPFRWLFRPVITVAVVLGFVAVVTWVFFQRGLGASAYDAFDRPHLLLLVFAVSVLSGGFHEFGHAAAARYSGAEPGAMGAGLYLVWPAFYTDVTDSYRLGRGGRIRTDLGGLYFNAIVVVLTFVWWWGTGWDALLLLVATQVLQMAQQLLPLLRFDGYHVLADLAGVPDLYQRIRPTLLGLLPHRWRSPENRMIKPWSRAVITLWVFVTIPMMALMLFALISAVPRIVGTAGSVIREDAAAAASAFSSGGGIDVAAHVLQVLGVVLPIVGGALILGRVGLRFFGGLARWGRESLRRRIMATLVASAAITLLLWTWWPHPGTYRPIEPGEKGQFTALLSEGETETAEVARPATGAQVETVALARGSAAQARLTDGQPLVAPFQQGTRLPTKQDPALAMVLVPTGATAPDEPAPAQPGSGEPSPEVPATEAQPWVFPFDAPLPPAEGDNQALAVASTDGTVSYDIAFALVWAEGDEVLNVNEAHAYASCADCVAVAVAFQVVLIMDEARVVVPQNLAVAANYDCYRCITAAIASQLVLSVQETPDEEQLLALGAVWAQLTQFAQSLTSYSLTEISDQLESFKSEIVAILGEAPPVGDAAAQSPSESATSADEGDAPSNGEPSDEPDGSPGESPVTTDSPSPTAGSSSPAPSSSPTAPSATAPTAPDEGSSTTSPSPTPSSSPEPAPTTTTSSEPTGSASSTAPEPSP